MLTSAHVQSPLTIPNAFFSHPLPSTVLPILCGTAIGFSINQKRTRAMYLALRQPPLNPPGWVFGPVWTCLYASMGYAAHRAWVIGIDSSDPSVRELTKVGAILYGLQLALNYLWTPLYFSLFRPVAASVDIVGLLGTVSTLAYTWNKFDPTSAWLLAPYLAWLSFASYLCIGAGYLNKWDFSHVKHITGEEELKRD